MASADDAGSAAAGQGGVGDERRKALERDIRAAVAGVRADLAVMVSDTRGWRLSVGANARKHLASVVKMLMVVVALRQAERGGLALADEVCAGAGPGQVDLSSSFLGRLHAGLRLTHQDLLYLMIALSDSTIYDYFFHLIGAGVINGHLQEMGLSDTRLDISILELNRRSYGLTAARFDGLDTWARLQSLFVESPEVVQEPEVAAAARAFRFVDHNYSTPHDLCFLLESLLRGELLGPAYTERAREMLRWQLSKNRLPAMLPPAMDGCVGHQIGLVAESDDSYSVINDCGFLDFGPEDAVVVVCLGDSIHDPAWAIDRAIGEVGYAAFRCFGPG